MPCEPVTSGVPTPTRPSSSTSSVAFRMKHVDSGGGGSGARRALTALGTNDTKLNLRLAKSLLTISQDKFAKKWNFDPVMEVPLAQGRFSWTPTISSSSISPEVCALSGLDLTPSCQMLGGLTSASSSGSRAAATVAGAASHDLAAAVTEAEDNAAALRTCLNLPGLGPDSDNHRAVLAPPSTGGALCQEQPRVPPMHPEEPISCMSPVGPSRGPPKPVSAGDANIGPTSDVLAVDATAKLCLTSRPHSPAVVPSTTIISSSSRNSVISVPGDASDVPPSVDTEVGAEASQDNQCQEIDPTNTTTPPAPTDESRQHSTGTHTQTCMTNYLHPRKRSSAHLKEAVHPSKAKKVMPAA